MVKKMLLYFFLLLTATFCYSQNNFSIIKHKSKESLHFQYVNNQILLPVTLNGVKLIFLVDTGVKQSILFNASISTKVLDLKHVKTIMVRGLGEDGGFEALESKNNLIRIGNVVCPDFKLLVILDEKFDLSARMGVNIHGIIGSELFKDFIICVNYNKKKITFNQPEKYQYKKCKKCKTLALKFHSQKPYINGFINTFDKKQFPVKLLIDSGSSESLWLFEKSFSNYSIPKKNFIDLLGRGLSGNIFGQKSKLLSFKFSDFEFNQLIISHPDSSSVIGNNIRYNRNGIIGSEILKRFHIIYDYPNNKITFKKNKRYYNKPFTYNKSGLEIIHYGETLVKEKKAKLSFQGNSYEQKYLNEISTYNYSFENVYQISYVKPNSIADKAGLKKNDILEKINGSAAYRFSLSQIIEKLSDKNGKKVNIQVNRNNLLYDYQITLEELL